MTTIDTAAIARKAEQMTANYNSVKEGATKLVADETASCKAWGQFAINLAEAEGAMIAWHRLNRNAEYLRMREEEMTVEHITNVVALILCEGADDTWSGRGNDVQRARFDGIRSACNDMKWITA